MNPSEFSEYVEKEGWSDAESEASDAETNMLDMCELFNLSCDSCRCLYVFT